MNTFGAQLDEWVRETEARMLAVLRASVQDVIEEAQLPIAKGGHMPVDTGFLRSSLQSSLNGSTALTGPDSYVLVAGQMKLGDVASFGWTAAYAIYVHYGARGRPGRMWAELAAQKWPAIVEANTMKAKAAAA